MRRDPRHHLEDVIPIKDYLYFGFILDSRPDLVNLTVGSTLSRGFTTEWRNEYEQGIRMAVGVDTGQKKALQTVEDDLALINKSCTLFTEKLGIPEAITSMAD